MNIHETPKPQEVEHPAESRKHADWCELRHSQPQEAIYQKEALTGIPVPSRIST